MYRSAGLLLIGGASLTFAGCGSLINTAVNEAGRRVVPGIGGTEAEQPPPPPAEPVNQPAPSPQMQRYNFADPYAVTMYSSFLFTFAFTPGGYWVEPTPYRPGEWTKWRVNEGGKDEGGWMERAFLKRTDDGKEWWRVAMFNAEEQDTVILEALFAGDRSTVLRLRTKFPGQGVAEMPVQEGTSVYREPIKLTRESLEGATVGEESVTVPAGTFRARHIRYGNIMGGGTVDWWVADGVPGGLVKYGSGARTDAGEGATHEGAYAFQLLARGADARTMLASYQ